VALHLAYHWFCKLDLDDKVSHHSTFSAASWEWRCWLRMFGCGKTLSGEMPVSRLRRRSLPARRLTSLWANKEVPYAKPSGAGKKNATPRERSGPGILGLARGNMLEPLLCGPWRVHPAPNFESLIDI